MLRSLHPEGHPSWCARNSCKARYNNFGQVALLVAVGNLDRFVELAFAQRAGDCRSELRAIGSRAALKAMNRSIITPIDHADMMNMTMTTDLPSTVIWFHIDKGVEADRAAAFLKEHQGPYLYIKQHWCVFLLRVELKVN